MTKMQDKIEILNDVMESKELRVNTMLELLYENEISLAQAKEICAELGVFSPNPQWCGIH